MTNIEVMITDLIEEFKKELEANQVEIKPVCLDYIKRGTQYPFAIEFRQRIEMNVARIAEVLFQYENEEFSVKRLFGIFIHEIVGHKQPCIIPPSKEVMHLLSKCTEEEAKKENFPYHVQTAIWGDGESRSKLIKAGYKSTLEMYERVWKNAYRRAQIKWSLQGRIYG